MQLVGYLHTTPGFPYLLSMQTAYLCSLENQSRPFGLSSHDTCSQNSAVMREYIV